MASSRLNRMARMLQLMRRTLKVGDPTEFHNWRGFQGIPSLILPSMIYKSDYDNESVWEYVIKSNSCIRERCANSTYYDHDFDDPDLLDN